MRRVPKVSAIAHLTVKDLGMSGVSSSSPLEDKARAVWLAAHRVAQASGGRPALHEGRAGVVASFTMSSIVASLFSDLGEEDRRRLSSLVSQVFKKTGAAACLASGKGVVSTWFVADEMPEDLVAVAMFVSAHGAAPMLSMTRAEERLSASEVGETRQPEPVTVRQVSTPQRDLAERLILDILAEGPAHGMTVLELVDGLAQAGLPRQESSVRKYVLAMADDGRVDRRELESRVERVERTGVHGRLAMRYALPTRHSSLEEPEMPAPEPEPALNVNAVAAAIAGLVTEATADLTRKLDELSEENRKLAATLDAVRKALDT